MVDVGIAHTSSFGGPELRAIRQLLDQAFVDFDDDAWEHCLGGMHATIWEADEVVGHASVIQRRLLHGGRALRTGYVEAVAVRADRRRRGYGRALMERIADVIRGAYDIGGLAAGDPAARLYRALGWRAWEGRTWTLGPNGLVRTPKDDGGIYILSLGVSLDFVGDIACDWRDGEVW